MSCKLSGLHYNEESPFTQEEEPWSARSILITHSTKENIQNWRQQKFLKQSIHRYIYADDLAPLCTKEELGSAKVPNIDDEI